jgi:hypothetical protein
VLLIVQVGQAEHLFRLLDAVAGEQHVTRILVDPVVLFRCQRACDLGQIQRVHRKRKPSAGEDQRHPCFIDHEGIRLIDDGVMKRPVHPVARIENPAVAQQVKPGLLGGGIRDVLPVGVTPFLDAHVVLNTPDARSEEVIHRAHPGRVAPRQIVIERQDVNPVATKRAQPCGRDRGKGLALSGGQFDDVAPNQRSGGHDLHIVEPQAEHAAPHLTRQGHALDDDFLAGPGGLTELLSAPAQFLVTGTLHLRFKVVDRLQARTESVHVAGDDVAS